MRRSKGYEGEQYVASVNDRVGIESLPIVQQHEALYAQWVSGRISKDEYIRQYREYEMRRDDSATSAQFFEALATQDVDIFPYFFEVLLPSIKKADLTQLEKISEEYAGCAQEMYENLRKPEYSEHRRMDRDEVQYADGEFVESITRRVREICKEDPQTKPRAEVLLLATLNRYVHRHVYFTPNAMLPAEYKERLEIQAHEQRIIREQEERTGRPTAVVEFPAPLDFVDETQDEREWATSLLVHEEMESQGENAYDIQPMYRAIPVLGEIGGRASIDLLVQWAKFTGAAMHPLAIADACSKIDVTYASKEIIQLLREIPTVENNKFREYYSRGLGVLLRRLEFGNISISREGAWYLERQYNLGQYNDPANFVRRISSDGKVGIFSRNKHLLKYFELGDVTSAETQVTPKILDIAYETLFFPKKGETKAERAKREQFLAEFQLNYFGLYDEQFFRDTGLAFNNLGLKEQGQFLSFYLQANESERVRAKQFVTVYREAGLRAFLAMEHDPSVGAALLDIGEKMDKASAQKVFVAYSQVVAAVDGIAQYVEQVFGTTLDEATYASMRERLLERGKKILRDIHEQTDQTQHTALDATRLLRQIHGDLIAYATIAKKLHQEGESKALKECIASSVETRRAEDLTLEERDTLIEVLDDSHTSAFPANLAQVNIRAFSAFLRDPSACRNAVFHLLKHGEKIAGFMRFDKEGPMQVHGASFNVRPSLRDSALGMTFMNKILEAYRGKYAIRGEVWAANPALPHYLAEGAIGTGAEANYNKSGEPFLFFEIPKQPIIFAQASAITMTYDLSKSEECGRFADEVERACQHGYRVTQCMRSGRGSKEVTLILQKPEDPKQALPKKALPES